jgi:Ca2+-binding RTX toxin-like protein
MTGGVGADTFVFAPGDSGATDGTFDAITDFVTGQDRIDLSTVGQGGLVANFYTETAVGSDDFAVIQAAAAFAMADGTHKAAFVAGQSDGWLFWDTDGNLATPDQSVKLANLSTVSQFDRTDIV